MGDALSTLLTAVRGAASGGVKVIPSSVPVPALNLAGGLQAKPNAISGQSDMSVIAGAVGTVIGTNGSGVVTPVAPTSLAFSVVDCATGYGATGANGIELAQIEDMGIYKGRTCGVGFGTTRAGHFCTGARFWWGDAHPLAISLWLLGGGTTPIATAATTGGSGSVRTASFPTPYALIPGVAYAITFFDTTTPTSSQPNGPGYWKYAGSTTIGQINMGTFMPGNGAPLGAQWGPYVQGMNFLANGSIDLNAIYGLDFNFSLVDTCPNEASTFWYPIEPIVS